MSSFAVTPSSSQINEGESLSTSLSGFTPGSTLFFKVTGRGINKKDFTRGGVKGSVKVDANGVATISHAIRADKATEGDESFAIQVFSDKKMRNLLGKSDAVKVFDTSVKAGKPAKGGNNGVKGGKDPVTGRTWLFQGNGRSDLIQDDMVYEITRGSLDTDMDDIIKPLNSIPTSAPPAGAAYMQLQLGSDRLVRNVYFQGEISRAVLLGEFSYDKNKRLEFGTPASSANLWESVSNPNDLNGKIFNFNPRVQYSAKDLDTGELLPNEQVVARYNNDGTDREESGGGLAAIRAFGGGKYFFEGWQNNLFDTSLV